MIFKNTLFFGLFIFINFLNAYDFCKDNQNILEKFNFYEDFGGKDSKKKLNVEDDLPYLSYQKKSTDNTIDQFLLLNMCGNEVDVSNNKIDFSKYESKSIIYGISKLESGSVYTDVINILSSDLDTNKVTLKEINDAYTGLNVFINNVKSNTFNITFQCDNNLKHDEFGKLEKKESFDIVSKEASNVWTMDIKGPSGCLTNGKDNKPVKENPSKKPKHSFFTYFFIYVMLFTVVYIGASSYIEIKDGGTLQDFEDVFKYKFKELMFSIPAFAKELYNKIVGNNFTRYTPTNNQGSGENDTRSGYAAV